MKILYLAFACNPYAGSEAQCGWSWPMAMRSFAEVSVITREENRENIEYYLKENGIDNISVYYYDIPKWMNVYYKNGKFYHLYYLLWLECVFHYVKRLHVTKRFEYIHQVTLGDFRLISRCYELDTKFIFGPVGGAQVTPDVFECYVKKNKISEISREYINQIVGMSPSYRKALNQTNLVLAANKETEIFIKRRMKEPNKCRLLTENGVRKECLIGMPVHKENDRVVLLWAGRMVNRKGLSFLLEVISLVKTECRFCLKLVGDGPELENLKEQAKNMEIADRVDFLDKVSYEEMQLLYLESDIFVFPSLRETTGTVLFEAMSKGIPVITFNQNGASFLIDDSCGRKVNIGHDICAIKMEFAEKIKELVERPEVRDKLGKQAYSKIEKEYTWEKKCKDFFDTYLNA